MAPSVLIDSERYADPEGSTNESAYEFRAISCGELQRDEAVEAIAQTQHFIERLQVELTLRVLQEKGTERGQVTLTV